MFVQKSSDDPQDAVSSGAPTPIGLTVNSIECAYIITVGTSRNRRYATTDFTDVTDGKIIVPDPRNP
jgi:hypothetical protein